MKVTIHTETAHALRSSPPGHSRHRLHCQHGVDRSRWRSPRGWATSCRCARCFLTPATWRCSFPSRSRHTIIAWRSARCCWKPVPTQTPSIRPACTILPPRCTVPAGADSCGLPHSCFRAARASTYGTSSGTARRAAGPSMAGSGHHWPAECTRGAEQVLRRQTGPVLPTTSGSARVASARYVARRRQHR